MTKWVEFHPTTGKPVAIILLSAGHRLADIRPWLMRKRFGGPVAIVREKKPPLDGRKLGCH